GDRIYFDFGVGIQRLKNFEGLAKGENDYSVVVFPEVLDDRAGTHCVATAFASQSIENGRHTKNSYSWRGFGPDVHEFSSLRKVCPHFSENGERSWAFARPVQHRPPGRAVTRSVGQWGQLDDRPAKKMHSTINLEAVLVVFCVKV
ncbi:MAG: hypothetical protein AAFY60_14860, partial [Myxococcota bacterium]